MRNKGQTPNNWQLQIRQIKTEIMKYIHTYIHLKAKSKLKKKCNTFTWLKKEMKNDIHQLRKKLVKAQTGKENQSVVPTGQ